MKTNIIISSSQQSWNKCAMGDTEQDHTFLVAEKVVELLKDYECNICLVPKLAGTESETLSKVVRISNDFVRSNEADMSFHLDIHTDAGYKGNGSSAFFLSEHGKSFIQKVHREVCNITPWGDSIVSHRSNLYILNATTAIAGLIEISFHDRLTEAKWIHQSIDVIARAIVRGIVAASGIAAKVVLDNFDAIIDAEAATGNINSPGYWKQNSVSGKMVPGELVRKLVCAIKKDGTVSEKP